jgi:hypothetical protein
MTQEELTMLYSVQISQQFARTIIVEAPDRESVRRHDWRSYRQDDPNLAVSVVGIHAIRTPEDDRDDLEQLADPGLDPFLREVLEGRERAPDPPPAPDLIITGQADEGDEEEQIPGLLGAQKRTILAYFAYRRARSLEIATAGEQGVRIKQVHADAMEDACCEFRYWPEQDIRRSIEAYLDRLDGGEPEPPEWATPEPERATEEHFLTQQRERPNLLAVEERSILSYFEYRRDFILATAMAHGYGVSPRRQDADAAADTVAEFTWWPEARIRESIQAYLDREQKQIEQMRIEQKED